MIAVSSTARQNLCTHDDFWPLPFQFGSAVRRRQCRGTDYPKECVDVMQRGTHDGAPAAPHSFSDSDCIISWLDAVCWLGFDLWGTGEE